MCLHVKGKARSLLPCNSMANDPSPGCASRRLPVRSAPSCPRPYSVALILLALGVFGWGFGYRLSLYEVHSGSAAHSSVVRMWDDSKSARTAHVPARSYAFVVADLHWTRHDPASLDDLGRADVPSAACPSSFLADSFLPSRAPPARLVAGPVHG